MSTWPAVLLSAAAVAVLLAEGPAAGRARSVLGRVRDVRVLDATLGRSGGPVPWVAERFGGSFPAVVAGVLVAAVGAGPVAAVLTVAGALVARRWWVRRASTALVAAERSRAVEACSALAGELRAGRSPAEALGVAAELAVGPSRRCLRAAGAAAGLGGDVAAALTPGPDTAVPEVLRALAACWTVCARSGGGLAGAVERLEVGLRADAAQRRSVQAELAGPRATAGMLAVLPLGGLLLAAGLGADPLHVLFRTPVGVGCLLAGLALDALGLLWAGRLVARAGG